MAGLGSSTSKSLKSEGVGSEEGLVARGNKVHCFLPIEKIEARQGKSNTDVHLGLQAGCAREQHLIPELSRKDSE